MQTLRTHIALKSFALFMAAWMLVLASGISINLHFCQQTVKSFSFLGEAPNCHQIMAKSSCHLAKKSCASACSASSKKANKKCCTNKNVQFELDTDLPHFEIINCDFSLEIALLTPVQAFDFYIQKPIDIHAYQNYRPPPLYRNYTKLYQQFLC